MRTRPEFAAVTEAEVIASRYSGLPYDPVAIEIARLIGGYAAEYQAYTSGLGYCPDSLFFKDEPQAPIEEFAAWVAMSIIRDRVQSYHRHTSHCG